MRHRLLACAVCAVVLLSTAGTAHAGEPAPTEVHWTELLRWNVLVTMDADASDADVDDVVEIAQRSTSPYVRIARLSVNDLSIEEELRTGAPVTADVAEAPIVRVAVPIEISVRAVERALRGARGIAKVHAGRFSDRLLTLCDEMWPIFDVGAIGVTVNYDVTPAQVLQLRAFLDSTPLVASYVYLDAATLSADFAERHPARVRSGVAFFNDQVRVYPSHPTRADELAAEINTRFAVVDALTWISSFPQGTCSRLEFISP